MDCPLCLRAGRFRWLTKSFKRWAFAKGEHYTMMHSREYARKYLVKFLKKQGKEAAGRGSQAFRVRAALVAATHTGQLLPAVVQKLVPDRGTIKPAREELVALVVDDCLRAMRDVGGASPSPAMSSRGGPRQQHVSISADDRSGWAELFAEYAVGLGEALDKNIGLDHSKVREYWLSRGPRLCMTAVGYFLFILVCQEALRGGTTPLGSQDRWYVVVTNVTGLLIALFLLYKRLGDAIEGVVARASHDYYAAQKKGDVPFRKLAQKVGFSEHDAVTPTARRDEEVGAIYQDSGREPRSLFFGGAGGDCDLPTPIAIRIDKAHAGDEVAVARERPDRFNAGQQAQPRESIRGSLADWHALNAPTHVPGNCPQ